MDDFVSVIFWVGFLCCLPPLVVGGPIGYVLYRNKQRREASAAIAQMLNLQPTAKAKQMQWYEGRLANGRTIAYLPIIFKRSYYDHNGRRRLLVVRHPSGRAGHVHRHGASAGRCGGRADHSRSRGDYDARTVGHRDRD